MAIGTTRPERMQVFKNETQAIVEHFLNHRLNFSECIAALDAALVGLIPNLKREQLPELRTLMLANDERVMAEVEKRERQLNPESSSPSKNRPDSN
jgi:hypothetical protein